MYCTVEDFKSAGMGGEHTDAEIEKAIKRACTKIDTWTGLCFKPLLKTYSFSGHGGETLHLDLDIISIESLLIDGYEVLPGDVRIVQNGLALYYENGWSKGKYNILLTGRFGRVTAEGETPAQIIEAAMRLAVRELVPWGDYEAQAEITRFGLAQSETTDGHSYTLAKPASVGEIGTYGYWTGDAAIDGVLSHFQAPTQIRCV